MNRVFLRTVLARCFASKFEDISELKNLLKNHQTKIACLLPDKNKKARKEKKIMTKPLGDRRLKLSKKIFLLFVVLMMRKK